MEVFRLFGSFFVKDESSNALDNIEKKAEKTDSGISKLESTFKKVGEAVTTMGNRITGYASGAFSLAKTNAQGFQSSAEELNTRMKVLKSEFDLASASTDKFGKTSDSLRVKQDLLSKQLDVQRQIVKNLEYEYENSAQAKGIDDKATQELAVELNNAKTEYALLAKEVKNTTKEITTQSEKFKATGDKLKQIGEGVTKVGQKLTTWITLPLVGAGIASFKFASDLSESVNKVEVAFKDSASTVEKWSDTTLNSFGIAKGSSLDMAALFGDMATSMGIGTKKAADMSMSLVGLAGDLASFKNIGIDEATTALNAIFTGETESLKRLGVVMTDANLQQFAYSIGIKKKTQEMTESEKVMLRYNYVLEKTKNAHGDFTNTSGGAANQMRIFKESLKELGSSFGQYLLPMITPLIKNLNEFVKYLGSLDEKTKKTIITIAGIVAVVGPVILIIGGLITTIGGLITAFSTIGAALGVSSLAVAGFAALIPLLIAAVAFLVVTIVTHWNEIKQTFINFTNWLGAVFSTDWSTRFGILGNILNGFVVNASNIFNSLKSIFYGFIDFITGVFTGNWSKAWNGVVSIFGGIVGGIGALMKMPLNAMIGLINAAISGLNRISVKIPDWVPEFGGDSFGLSIPKMPYLANGGTVLNGDAIVGEAGAELLRVRNGKTSVIPLTNQERKVGQDNNKNLNNDNSRLVELLMAILEWIKIIANNPSEFDVDGKKLWESMSPYAALATKRRR